MGRGVDLESLLGVAWSWPSIDRTIGGACAELRRTASACRAEPLHNRTYASPLNPPMKGDRCSVTMSALGRSAFCS